jgi:3-oxoacyl-[acyl-carrier protein] reductase
MSNQIRTAIITGSARGIGAEIARRFAADGMAVAVADLSEEDCARTVEEIRQAGGTAEAFGIDVSDEESVNAAVAAVAEKLGQPTVLVNNAGITRDNMLFKMSVADWDAVMSVHLRGAFLVTRAVQAHMVEQHYGRIINMSSAAALGNRGQANYSAAKAGIQGFTKTVAIELGPFGVTANVIAPSFVITDMTAATAERMGISFEEFQAQSAAKIAVRRVGTPADISHLASFLAHEDSGFITGQVIYAAGSPRV